MPQLNQLPDIFYSQLFWLLVVFGAIYFGVGRGMVPKIQSTVEKRDRKIAEDLARAQEARAEADRTEEAYRERINASRMEAARLSQEAKQAASRDTEAKIRAAADEIGARTAAAEAKIRDAIAAAKSDIEAVAVEATRDLVQRLTGEQVKASEVADRVKAELHV